MDEFFTQESTIPAMKVRKPDPVEPRTSPNDAAQSMQSFEDLFLEHWNSICRLLLHITGDTAEAEDPGAGNIH